MFVCLFTAVLAYLICFSNSTVAGLVSWQGIDLEDLHGCVHDNSNLALSLYEQLHYVTLFNMLVSFVPH